MTLALGSRKPTGGRRAALEIKLQLVAPQAVVAIQIEAETRARSTPEGQRDYARALTSAVLAWLKAHYGWELDVSKA